MTESGRVAVSIAPGARRLLLRRPARGDFPGDRLYAGLCVDCAYWGGYADCEIDLRANRAMRLDWSSDAPGASRRGESGTGRRRAGNFSRVISMIVYNRRSRRPFRKAYSRTVCTCGVAPAVPARVHRRAGVPGENRGAVAPVMPRPALSPLTVHAAPRGIRTDARTKEPNRAKKNVRGQAPGPPEVRR